MKFFITATILLSLNAFSVEMMTCREAVVEASKAVNEPMEADKFSVYSPSSFYLSAEEYNALSAKDQVKVYFEYMPLETMVQNYRSKINREIAYYSGNPFAAIFYADTLQTLRGHRDALDQCVTKHGPYSSHSPQH